MAPHHVRHIRIGQFRPRDAGRCCPRRRSGCQSFRPEDLSPWHCTRYAILAVLCPMDSPSQRIHPPEPKPSRVQSRPRPPFRIRHWPLVGRDAVHRDPLGRVSRSRGTRRSGNRPTHPQPDRHAHAPSACRSSRSSARSAQGRSLRDRPRQEEVGGFRHPRKRPS